MVVLRRKTQQRDVVIKVLTEADRPLSPQEILKFAQRFIPRLGIATVYRNIKNMVEDGTLEAVELPGTIQRYEIAGKHHHHHFHCNSCGKVYEIEGCSIGAHTNIPQDFELEDHVVVLYGRCANCRTENIIDDNKSDSSNERVPCRCQHCHESQGNKENL